MRPVSLGGILRYIRKAGVLVGERPALNFVEGSGVTITVTDDGTSNEIDVEIAASGGPAVSDAAPPVGSLMDWAGTVATVPANWLFADGSSLLRASYVALFAAIGTTWGAADGTHFSLPDTRDMFIVGARQDSVGIAKANIRGALEQSASATGATLTHNGSIADHPTLAHAGVAITDHPSLSHAGFTPTSHPTSSLSHAAEADHPAFTASAHATGGLTHGGFTPSTHPTGSLSHAGFTPSSHPTGSLSHAAEADHSGFTPSTHPTGSLSHAGATEAAHPTAAFSLQTGTASRVSVTLVTPTASHSGVASFTHPALSHDGFAALTHKASSVHPALSHDGLATLAHAALSHDGLASANHAALSHDGVAAATHKASSTHPALSHDGLASAAHAAVSHAITQPNNHGAVTHSFTAPSDHTASIVPNFLAMPKIIRYA